MRLPSSAKSPFETNASDRQSQLGKIASKRFRFARYLDLTYDLARRIRDADAALFQRHVNARCEAGPLRHLKEHAGTAFHRYVRERTSPEPQFRRRGGGTVAR